MRKCKVVNRPLTINGLALQPGEELYLPDEDAALFIARGRLADAEDPTPPSEPEETADDAPAADVDEEIHSSEDEPAEPEPKE